MKNEEEVRLCLDGLIENRVIFENNQNELFRLIKKNLSDLRKICFNDLGLQILLNSGFIKLEKIPEVPQTYMGIDGFFDAEDYVMFACVMAYVEEEGTDATFILPELTDQLKRTMPVEVDWNDFQTRKRFVRVMQQLNELSIIKVLDGNLSEFDRNENEDVLFNTTEYASYFLRRFPEDLQNIQDWHDLQSTADEHPTRIKVIQSLFFTTGICRNNDNEELFRYMRNQKGFLIEYFEKYSFYEFELSRNVGMLVSPNRRFSIKYVPDNSSSGDLMMIVGEKIRFGEYSPDEFGQIHLQKTQWQSIVTIAVNENRDLLSKTFREKSPELLSKELLTQTTQIGLTKISQSEVIITPIFARLSGRFIQNKE